MATTPKSSRRQWRGGFLFLMAVSFAVAAVMPTPSLTELDIVFGELVSVNPSENNHDTQLHLAGNDIDTMFFVRGMSLAEKNRVRSLSPGTNLQLWYLDPPFGLELDVWQIKIGDEVIVAPENRLIEFQLTQRIFLAVGGIFGVIAFFPYVRCRISGKPTT